MKHIHLGVKQTDTHKPPQSDIRMERKANKRIDIRTDKHVQTNTHMDEHMDGHTHTRTDRQTDYAVNNKESLQRTNSIYERNS